MTKWIKFNVNDVKTYPTERYKDYLVLCSFKAIEPFYMKVHIAKFNVTRSRFEMLIFEYLHAIDITESVQYWCDCIPEFEEIKNAYVGQV